MLDPESMTLPDDVAAGLIKRDKRATLSLVALGTPHR